MTTPVFWVMPLLLLPGVALMVLSTATRFGQVHDEIHRLMGEDRTMHPRLAKRLFRRARMFRQALVALYGSVCFFSLGSLAGAIMEALMGETQWIVIAFALGGTVSLLYAAVRLVQESRLSLIVIELHLDDLTQDHADE